MSILIPGPLGTALSPLGANPNNSNSALVPPDQLTSATLLSWWDWTTASYHRQSAVGLSVSSWNNPNGGTIGITTSTTHGLSSGDYIHVVGDGGTQVANGVWVITVTSTTAFNLNGSVGNGSFLGSTQTVYGFKTTVTTNGQNIAFSVQRAGINNYNVYESSSGNQPTWVTSAVNSNAAARFTATSNQRLSLTQLASQGSRALTYPNSNLTWFLCGSFIGTPSGRIFSQRGASDSFDYNSLNGGGINYNAPGIQLFSIGRSPDLLVHDNSYTGGAFYVVARMSSGNAKINVNGSVATATYGSSSSTISPDQFRVGAMAQNGNSDAINAYMCHSGIYRGALSDAEFDQLVAYLKNVVGL